MNKFVIGFTGTRSGMTDKQKEKVEEIILSYPATHGLHGDCLGADEDFHNIGKRLGLNMQQRPCTFDNMRANTDAEEIAEPKPPMTRNRDIVADCDILIGTPWNYFKIKSGSGTWATIGFGKRAKKPVFVVYPDGTVDETK